jgi:hydrogenase-4 component F
LPEAYSEAPAPVTAMLAGVLETVAVYAVLRSKSIVDQAVSPEFTGNLLIFIGLISFATAALFILIQRDYKRLFAYSSIEHMGLAMVGFGVGGPLGTFGGLWHLLNHALAKSLGFFAAGNIFLRYRTRQIHEVKGMVKIQPITAMAFLVGGLALVGMPPFSIFNSELLVISSLAQMSFQGDSFHLGRFLTITVSHEIRSLGMVMVVLLLAVALFGGFIYRLTGMVWGMPPPGIKQGEAWHIGQLPLALSAFALVWMGFHLPTPIETLLQRATIVVMGR